MSSHNIYFYYPVSNGSSRESRVLICKLVGVASNFMKKLRDGYMPSKLVKRVNAGDEKTTSQWANEFGITKSQMSDILVGLRKGGYLFFPIGTKKNFGNSKEGVIKNIMGSKKHYREASKNYLKGKVNCHIAGMFSIIENTLIEFPEISAEVETSWNSILIEVLTRKEQLKLNNPYANSTSSNKQTETR